MQHRYYTTFFSFCKGGFENLFHLNKNAPSFLFNTTLKKAFTKGKTKEKGNIPLKMRIPSLFNQG